MKIQQVLSLVRRAIDDYDMIEDNDKIAVGISGGKDSLTLLSAMAALRRFYPKKFELYAITVDLGFKDMNLDPIKDFCRKLDVPYTIIQTDIAEIVFDERKEKNPCSLCAKMRKGSLYETAKSMGIDKIAYAHHKDDVVETMLLSLIYEGRFHTFAPVTFLDRMQVTIIRPMIYMDESSVKSFTYRNQLPVVKNSCPADGNTRREYVHNLLRSLELENRGTKNRMFTAICGAEINGYRIIPGSERVRTKSAPEVY